nr:putative polynucleotide kinase [Pithovirus mammoth]
MFAQASPSVSSSVSNLDKVSQLLGVPISRHWSKADSNEDLELYHFAPEADVSQYGSVRGVVVDPVENVIVARSYDYTPTLTADKILLDDNQGLSVVDDEGKLHLVEKDKFFFRRGFEGTIMRVFKHNGKVYHSSHRRLDTYRSRWGTSPPFLQIYQDLGGPKDEELFNPEMDFSPHCHVFLMVHPSLLNASLQVMDSGYIVYLGSLKMWGEDKFVGKKIDWELHRPSCVSSLPEEISSPFLLAPPESSLEEANLHLEKGWNGVDGEFIIIYIVPEKETESRMPHLLKVASTSYQNRSSVRNNDPNIYHRFVEMSSDATGLAKNFTKTYGGPEKTTLRQRLELIRSSFALSLPLHMRAETVDFVSRLQTDRDDLSYWLTGLLWQGMEEIENSKKLPKRIPQILSTFRKRNLPKSIVRSKISVTLVHEDGTSLYQMIKFMKKWKKEKERREALAKTEEETPVEKKCEDNKLVPLSVTKTRIEKKPRIAKNRVIKGEGFVVDLGAINSIIEAEMEGIYQAKLAAAKKEWMRDLKKREAMSKKWREKREKKNQDASSTN